MAEERNRYQRRKIFLTVMHVLFLVVTAAGISAMYLNSDYGGMCLRQMESWIWSGPLWGSATAPGSARS